MYAEQNIESNRQVNDSSEYKSSIQRLLEDPNIRIVTDVPGLSWHVEYKVPPPEKKHGLVRKLFGRGRR